MTNIDGGGSAFPQTCLNDPCHPASIPGMSLRDWFAGQALSGLLTRGPGVDMPTRCAQAYNYADAMLTARIAEIEAENARLREALGNCVSTLKLVEHPAFENPLHGPAVRELGERIGYGALMSSASASWRKSAEKNGYPPGGEFVAGPCFTTVVGTLRRARAALAGQGYEE